jgi:capsular exopolysaccharide synthesis family protein
MSRRNGHSPDTARVPRGWSSQLRTASEAFRVVRSNLAVAIGDVDHPVVVVTSAYPNEGKTSTTVSLAYSFASAGQRVTLVDLDLRDPDAHRALHTHNEVGVSDVLVNNRDVDECIQHLEVGDEGSVLPVRISLLAAGPPVANPTELLSTTRTARLLERLAADADVVLLDAPPVLSVADTLVIGRHATGAVLVVEAGRTPAPAARRAKDALTRNQTRLLGVVLNKFKAKHAVTDEGESPYSFAYGATG